MKNFSKFWAVILERKIVPVQDELTHWARQEHLIQSTSRGVVKSYMKFYNKNKIIIKAMAIPVWGDDEIVNMTQKLVKYIRHIVR